MTFKKGHNTWNKGLTKKDDDRIPQPWLGKRRSKETIKKTIETKKRLYKEGKLKSWNKGLHGEELLKHYKNGHPRGMLGKTAWNKGKKLIGKYSHMGFQEGHKVPKEWRESLRKQFKGRKAPWVKGYKKGHTPWNKGIATIKKICEQCKKEFTIAVESRKNQRFCSKECLFKANIWLGRHHTEKSREKLSKSVKKLWKKEEYIKKVVKKWSIKPNYLEKKLIRLLEENNLPYKYIGDWSFWLDGKNPDFLNCNGQKKLIELFGRHWHEESEVEERKNHFAKYGFKTLIIWSDEMKDTKRVLNIIKNFDEGK